MAFRNLMFKVTAGATPDQVIYPDNTTGSAEIKLANEDIYVTSETYRDYGVPRPSAGSAYSYERWFQVWWGDADDTTITNVRFNFTGTLPGGWAMRMGVNSSYRSPINTPDDGVTPYTIASAPAGNSMALPVTLTNGIYKSDYVVLQLVVPSTATATGSSELTFTVLWDEI